MKPRLPIEAPAFHTFRRLTGYFLRYKWRILGGLFSVAMMSFSDVLTAALVGLLFKVLGSIGTLLEQGQPLVFHMPITVDYFHWTLYDITIAGRDETFFLILKLTLAMVAVYVFKAVFIYTREYLMSSVQQRLLLRFRTDLFNTVVFLPVRYYDQQKTGTVMSRITNDVNNLEQSLMMIVEIVQNIVYSIVFTIFLLMTNWQLTLFTVVIFAGQGTISRKFGDRIRHYSKVLSNTLAEISAFLQEKISSIRTVKSFTREEYERESFRRKADKNYHYSMKVVRIIALLSPTMELFNAVVTAVLVVFTAYLFVSGSMTIGLMVQFLLLVNGLAKPAKALGDGVARVQKTLVSAGFIFELIDLPKETVLPASGVSVIGRGEVEFRGVSLSYNGETQALRNVSFTAAPGERIAVVGPSGAGKTSLINLLPRFYEASEGSITIDGLDTRTLGLGELRSQIAIVPQEVALFAGSINENIQYGRLDASEEDIIAASKAANAHEFIVRLEQGYHTEVGERGFQLSGGQRQRLAIARALLRNPRLLLLDEATSALDSESEKLVQEALNRLMEGRTTFIIAHRLSTILHCDKILVLDRGVLVEQGTHKTLLRKRNGVYRRLYELQMSKPGAR